MYMSKHANTVYFRVNDNFILPSSIVKLMVQTNRHSHLVIMTLRTQYFLEKQFNISITFQLPKLFCQEIIIFVMI